MTVTDPDGGQTETAAITYAAANGLLSGAGLTGAAGSYTLSAASAAARQRPRARHRPSRWSAEHLDGRLPSF